MAEWAEPETIRMKILSTNDLRQYLDFEYLQINMITMYDVTALHGEI